MPVGTELAQRIEELTARAGAAQRARPPLDELDDLLSAGYACALAGEARIRRLAEERDDLLEARGAGGRDLRDVARDLRTAERAVGRLRAALQRLQPEFAAAQRGR